MRVTAFVQPGKLADVIREFTATSEGTVPKELVHSIKVTTFHLGYKRRYKLQAIETTPARITIFYCDEYKKNISVQEYFQRKHGTILDHPDDLPVVNVGSSQKKTYLPAELCDVEPQTYRGKLNKEETQRMLKAACNRPILNATKITQEGFQKLGFLPPTSPSIGFNVSVSNEMAVIPARELSPPCVTYSGANVSRNPVNGTWNIVNDQFHRGHRFRGDEIQKGTHDASYLYARATRSVSLIPPAYYADLACERGRCYLGDFLVGNDDDKSGSKGSGKKSNADSKAKQKQVFEDATGRAWGQGLHQDVRSTMFYI
ncbi:hypothetical protein D9758_004491 [Tetrapyrgos nigripes]|uniref:PAZ domain-containing protein n=1 Tax=Tetrapyrgos nigripes TaxID=182062 RepID=A0A8H5GNG8_9AGAR|nr:hypothetical protein D9758_004491 [Tetrapyrgos nigripes]